MPSKHQQPRGHSSIAASRQRRVRSRRRSRMSYGPSPCVLSEPKPRPCIPPTASIFRDVRRVETGIWKKKWWPATAIRKPITTWVSPSRNGPARRAIAEFQKVCTAIDRGHAFSQTVQTYTWLAQCFLDKGVPESAIHWYEKSLRIPGLDEEGRMAITTSWDRPAKAPRIGRRRCVISPTCTAPISTIATWPSAFRL